jgi:hypothetical protein
MLIFPRLFIVYLFALVVITPLVWFILRETKGQSLEEIGTVFGDRHTAINLSDAPEKGVVDPKERYIGKVSGQL